MAAVTAVVVAALATLVWPAVSQGPGPGLGSVHFPAWSALQDRAEGAGADLASLAIALRQHLPDTQDGNMLLSPLSIAVVLAALQMGARGPTAHQIGHLLGQHDAGVAVQTSWANLGSTLRAVNTTKAYIKRQRFRSDDKLKNRVQDGFYHSHINSGNTESFGSRNSRTPLIKNLDVIASVASALFVDATFLLNEAYRQNARALLSSEEFSVDFSGGRASAVAAVNRWVSAATRGRIPSILDDVDANTALVVVSAVYFNGAWRLPFPAKMTRPEQFRVSPTEVRTVHLMLHAGRVPYAYSYEHRCKVLCLPYKGGAFAMFVLLPDDEGEASVRRLEDELTPSSLLRLLASAAEDDDVIYMLPRFSLEASYSLKQPLHDAGVRALFDPFRADLSGLVADVNMASARRRGLSASDVVHRVRVEVTETGTEAVAATAAWVTRTRHPVVRADRPFLFAIQHLPSSALLFWGAVVRP